MNHPPPSPAPLGHFYDEVVAGLRAAGIGAAAPEVGETFPDFSLPTLQGGYRRLGDVLAAGPVIVNFSRGRWCPYCGGEVTAWAAMLPALAEAGVRFLEITGETGGGAHGLGDLLAASPAAAAAEVLCDVDHGVALSLGLAFYAGQPLLDAYHARGIDLGALYGSHSGFLPVPATFALDASGTVRFAFTDVDFRIRAEPAEVLAALM